MTIWVVGISDCESNSIVAICTTKEIAEREMFKTRDKLVANWKEMDGLGEDMYKKMIAALSGNDYENWDNYPHDEPYLYETTVVEK